MTIAAIVAVRASSRRNGTTGRSAAISGATPWTRALTMAANRKASRCSSLKRAKRARSIVRISRFFSTRSASYARTALLTARAIAAPNDADTTRPLCDSKSPKAEEPMMIPRTVSAPSNAPMTKYRRMIGPTFVISSYSRSRRRQARKSMSSALDPEFLPHEFLKFRGGGARHVDVRETRLREVGLAPALAPEFRRDRADEPGGIDRDLNSPGDRKSTRLNSSHVSISYAVFCLKKKTR